MKLVRIESLAELRRRAEPWNDLWRRSDVTLPTVRAELTAQWIEHFAPQRSFIALAVEDEGALVAALPLVADGRRAGLLAAKLPRNCWTDAGDLLLDPAGPVERSVELLADGLRGLPWSVVHGDGVEIDNPRWSRFVESARERGHAAAFRKQFDVGWIDIGEDWAAYEAGLSGNHRRAVRKSLRRLEAEHPVALKIHRHFAPSEAAHLLRSVCDVEDKSWKGQAGTSILRVPGMLDFFTRQAELLAEAGQVEILFLEQNGRTLAAEYGFAAKGVYHSHKIAYDPEFRHAGPGRLLRCLQLQRYFAERTYEAIDTLGVLSDANARWSTRHRQVGRLVLGAGGPVGNALVFAYDRLWPGIKRLLGRVENNSRQSDDSDDERIVAPSDTAEAPRKENAEVGAV